MDIRGIDYQTGKPIRLEISNGKIIGVYALQDNQEISIPYIAGGLVDLQVNGFKGVDFNTSPIVISEVKELTHSLWEQGVTNFFPTIITNTDQLIFHALKDILSASKAYPEVEQSIDGIHLEGPFISGEDGPRGAHNKAYVRPPDWELFSGWQEAAEGKIKIITLSPEWPGSNKFIEQCVKTGVKVSIGHTAANAVQIKEAVLAGATLSTHLGNASHLMLPRHSNYIWEQLASENLWSSIIADGFHLPDSILKVFLKVKPEKSFLVSDVTCYAGLLPGVYSGHIGGEVELSQEGRLFVAGNPETMAGSAQSLLWCVNYLIKKDILPLKEAWNLASLKPKEFLNGAVTDAFQIGAPADLVLFSKNEEGIKILQTIKSGKTVFSKNTPK